MKCFKSKKSGLGLRKKITLHKQRQIFRKATKKIRAMQKKIDTHVKFGSNVGICDPL